jgi:hypothetical protein
MYAPNVAIRKQGQQKMRGKLMHIHIEVALLPRKLTQPRRKVMSEEWIDVKDELPELDTEVLLFDEEDGCQVGYRTSGKPYLNWVCSYAHDGWSHAALGDVTHWMPLPKPPATKED